MVDNQAKSNIAMRVTNNLMYVILNIIFYALVVIFSVQVCRVTYDFSYQLFGDVTVNSAPGVERKIQITESDSIKSIAKKLEENKLIVNQYSFYAKVKLMDKEVYPGTYTLNSSMTYDQILDVICGNSSAS